jgi:hypothetical protein
MGPFTGKAHNSDARLFASLIALTQGSFPVGFLSNTCLEEAKVWFRLAGQQGLFSAPVTEFVIDIPSTLLTSSEHSW